MTEVAEERRGASRGDRATHEAESGTEVEESGTDAEDRGGAEQRHERERDPGKPESTFGAVARDMAVGALLGAAVGAAWRLARTLQPEGAEALKANVAGAAKEVGAAAGSAVRDVVASKPVNELISARGADGRRAEMMRSTLKEAVAAAGDAAKGVLESKGAGGSARREE